MLKGWVASNKNGAKTNREAYESKWIYQARVKLATQVVNNFLVAAMNAYVSLQGLLGDAIETTKLLEKFDNIFHYYNSLSFKDPKLCCRPFKSNSPLLEV